MPVYLFYHVVALAGDSGVFGLVAQAEGAQIDLSRVLKLDALVRPVERPQLVCHTYYT